MTQRHFTHLQCAVLTLTTCFALAGCVSAGTSGKNAQPNSSGDATQIDFPASAPAPVSQSSSEYALTPGGKDSASSPEPGTSPTERPQANPTARHGDPSVAPAAAGQAGSPAGAARAPSTNADETTASSGARAKAEARSSAPPQRPNERPGLATLWGEARTSWVTTTTFHRSSNQPWSLMRIQYDDETGILSRIGQRSVAELASNIAETLDGWVSVQLIDERGDPLPGLAQGSRTYVVGHQGDRYGIRVMNHSRERFEVVATVDGLDVVDCRPGSFAKRGYLVDADSSLDIDGFRRSSSEVAAFRFGSVRDSYAARTSGDRNVGVIGVAVFREYREPPPDRWDENRRRDTADPFPNRFAAPPPPMPLIQH